MASAMASRGWRVSAIPALSQTARASAIRASTCERSPGSVQTGPTGSPVSADRGLVAELKTTFVHCGPAGVAERVRAQTALGQQPGEPLGLAHRRRAGLERAEPRVPGRVVPDHAGRDDGACGDDAAADDPRHQLGDDLLVAEPVLQADDGRVGEGGARAGHRRPGVQRLGRDQAEVAVREVARVRFRACTRRGEVRQPGDPQPARGDRVDVLGPRVDHPDLDALGSGRGGRRTGSRSRRSR